MWWFQCRKCCAWLVFCMLLRCCFLGGTSCSDVKTMRLLAQRKALCLAILKEWRDSGETNQQTPENAWCLKDDKCDGFHASVFAITWCFACCFVLAFFGGTSCRDVKTLRLFADSHAPSERGWIVSWPPLIRNPNPPATVWVYHSPN